MRKIDSIWQTLESDATLSSGLMLRRYSGGVLPDVFVAVKNPEKVRCIAVSLYNAIEINFTLYNNLEDIDVELLPDATRNDRNMLLIKLINVRHSDIFSVLCEDLIESISSVTKEEQLVKELLNRLEKWKSLFNKASADGLSPEEQRGLYGELFFIRRFILNSQSYLEIIESWVGPEKTNKRLSAWRMEC